ncbi:MAG: SGNH/GDSL hydrolase family protein [Puniceicoccaceae bacterium]
MNIPSASRVRRRWLPLFLVFFLTLPLVADARKILCVGDSVTQGFQVDFPYPARLQQLLGPGSEVVNAGIGGELIFMGLERLPGLLARHRPTHVLILHGTNNVTFFLNNGENMAGLRAMADLCWTKGAVPIIGTVTPHTGPRANRRAHAAQLNRLIRWNRQAGSYLVADVGLAFGNGAGLMQPDGFHPNDAGMAVIAAAFFDLVFIAEAHGPAPRWSETFRTWIYPQDGGRFWSYDYFVVTPDIAPGWSQSSELGLMFTGDDSGFIWNERFGWTKTGASGGESFLYSPEIRTWISPRWDGSYYSFDYGALEPLSGFKRYQSPIFGPSWVDSFGGWIFSDRFGWSWADRAEPLSWFYTGNEGWLGLDPGGSGLLWSVARGRWISPGG